MDINVGDVVTLKSGGPKMTVQAKLQGGGLDCAWFDKDGNCLRHTFALESLEKADEKEDKHPAGKKSAA